MKVLVLGYGVRVVGYHECMLRQRPCSFCGRPCRRPKFCSQECYNASGERKATWARTSDGGLSEADVARFWSKVNTAGPIPAHMPHLGNCWPWTAGTFDDGYGAFKAQGKTKRAHKVAFTLENGSVEAGMLVCHHCDVPACCRPSHLFLGSDSENKADALSKGRDVKKGPDGKWLPCAS